MVRHFLKPRWMGPQRCTPPPPASPWPAPVHSGQARLTNLPWRLSETDLAALLLHCQGGTGERLRRLIYGLPHLRPHQLEPIRAGQAVSGEPLLILGAGTGLGVAIGIPGPAGLRAVASEAGHGSFAPRTAGEWELREWLRHDLQLERVSIERVVSGTGLGHTARWLLARRHPAGDHPLTPIARRWENTAPGQRAGRPARRRGRRGAPGGSPGREALEIWLAAYGAVAGDLALTCLCRGGIWLAGGTAAKLLEEPALPTLQRRLPRQGSPAAGPSKPIPIQAADGSSPGLLQRRLPGQNAAGTASSRAPTRIRASDHPWLRH
jgi:glucokinase